MSIIEFNHKGNFNKIERFFNRVLRMDYLNILSKYGEKGVTALQSATPVDSGETANSWNYGIEKEDGAVTIYWTNSHTNNGVNIAILLIYGHGLRNGGYVVGNDFVTPALQPIFQEMANESWKEVTRG